MKRYEGLLRPLSRPAPWPSRWVVVATAGQPVEVVGRERIRQTGLSRWAMAVVSMRGAEVLGVERSAGSDPAGAWQSLSTVAARQGLTWTISPRALYSWTLLGLWERLLLHDVAIANDSPARRRSGIDRGLQREPGMLLVGDPPSAAMLLIGPERRRVTWTCARNYGWDVDAESGELTAQVDTLVEIIAATSAALERHQLGGWCATVGAMSLRSWRSQHMGECLYVDEHERAEALLRRATVGGRVTVSANGTTVNRAWHCDTRGGYGHISYGESMPTGLRRVCHGQGVSPTSLGERAASCCAQVHLRRGQKRYPVRTEEGVEYPDGPCETVLCGPELADAITRGLVSKIGEYCEYRMGSPLRGYQLACYQMRCAAESRAERAVAVLAKGLAVSVIGKLHSYAELWEECVPDYNDPICGTWYGPDGKGGQTEYRAVAGSVSRKRRAGLSAHAIPALPLWVWSYGRLRLLRCIEVAGSDNVLYAHTDGLVVTERGFANLSLQGRIKENEWGQLRLVAGPVECEILGPHCVRIGEEVIQPGAPRDQRGQEYAENGYWFRRPFQGGNGPWMESTWEEQCRYSEESD